MGCYKLRSDPLCLPLFGYLSLASMSLSDIENPTNNDAVLLKYHLNVLEALTLLFADHVKMVTRRTQSMSLHNSLTVAWDLPINRTKCSYLRNG